MFIVISMQDISNEKRKQKLERIFFHDAINILSGIQSGIKYLKSLPDKNDGLNYIELSEKAIEDLFDEIKSFRDLSSAEKGDIVVSFHPYKTSKIITDVIKKTNALCIDKNIDVEVKKGSI